ncbi:MAG: hypothetical protein Q9167_007714 [Letrouitia subvulpina]
MADPLLGKKSPNLMFLRLRNIAFLAIALLISQSASQQVPIAEVFTYWVVGCPPGNFLMQFASYNLAQSACRDLPPSPIRDPDGPQEPFMSFRAGAANPPAQTSGCKLRVFSGNQCTGFYEDFPINEGNLGAKFAQCQELAIVLGANGDGVEGRSGSLECSDT